ncbi:MAG: thiamine diphosphokinase, partial [Eubacteriales bacterium]
GIVVGDMDSATRKVVGVPLLRFPVRKDDTDLSLALKLGSLAGYKRFRLYGAGGGPREDHFFAAIQLMAGWSRRGMAIRLIASSFTLYAITDGSLIIPTISGKTISVFSYSPESSGVTLLGLDYEENNLTLRHDVPLGVSNAAAGRRAFISVRRGTLIIWQTV